MSVLFTGMGTELIVDEAFIVMREKLNGVITEMNAEYAEYDQSLAARLGTDLVPIEVELVDDTPREKFPHGNFHVGSIPGFVTTDDRVTNYPMVVVEPGNTVPDAENASMDQMDVFTNAIQFHAFAKASPVEGELVAYRRAMRMAEAMHRVIKGDSRLKQVVSGVSGPILVTRSQPWYFPAEDGHGEDWVWRAIMHQYQVKNYSTTPQEV